MILREHYLQQIRPFYDSDLIKIITGISMELAIKDNTPSLQHCCRGFHHFMLKKDAGPCHRHSMVIRLRHYLETKFILQVKSALGTLTGSGGCLVLTPRYKRLQFKAVLNVPMYAKTSWLMFFQRFDTNLVQQTCTG